MTKTKVSNHGALIAAADKLAEASKPFSDAVTGKRNLLSLTVLDLAKLHVATVKYLEVLEKQT